MRRSGRRSSLAGRRRHLARGGPVDGDMIVETVAVTGSLGSHALEALQLEIRRLADACGLDVQMRVETVAEEPSP